MTPSSRTAIGVALLLAVATTACARGWDIAGPRPGWASGDRRARAAIAALQRRVDDLEGRIGAAGRDRARFEEGVLDRTRRVEHALQRVHAAVSDLDEKASSASARAEHALAAADAAARDLSVLTRRFDYHLRRYHGGA